MSAPLCEAATRAAAMGEELTWWTCEKTDGHDGLHSARRADGVLYEWADAVEKSASHSLKVVPITDSKKVTSSHAWSPLQCLEDAVHHAKTSEILEGVLVIFVHRNPDGTVTIDEQRSSMSMAEENLYVDIAKLRVIARMRGED